LFQEVLESPVKGNEDSPKREFELWDCLDFVKGGVEAIIEDLVTSRFEAEELRVRATENYLKCFTASLK